MLTQYIQNSRFSDYLTKHYDTLENGRCRNHPGKQRVKPGGLALHIEQVIRKALELNQTCDERELIDCILVHDLPNCLSLDLTENQRWAIKATKGLANYKDWRPTPSFRFVVLILISDMWSAFINEHDVMPL